VKYHRPVAIFLTPVLPLPGQSGRALRAWAWLNDLNRTHKVYVLVANDTEIPLVPADYPAEGVWSVQTKTSSAPKLLRILGILFPPICLLSRRVIADWHFPIKMSAFDHYISELSGEDVNRIVVFRFYLHGLGQIISRYYPSAKLELDMDDLESFTRVSVAGCLIRMKRYRESIQWMVSAVQYVLLELFITRSYSTVWLASAQDGSYLRKHIIQNIEERPNRIPLPDLKDINNPNKSDILRLLFVGTLNYPPNEEAILYLLNKIQPEIEKRLKRPWKLCVVGRHASPLLAQLLEDAARVEFFPDAERLEFFYAAAQIIIVPLRSGGGTKLKSIEAFSYRRPLVSTRHGMRGIGATAGIHYLAAETPDQFADAIALLANDPLLAERISQDGETFCRESYGLL
jgi:polysaccharide biosynthesis protein PslH